LLLAGVTDRFAHRIDVACQCRLRDNPAAPNSLQQVVARDDLIPVLNQIEQQIEDFRADRDELRTTCELAPVGVQAIIFE
jgi:hypothetical protein